jgi:hypothetical protein
LQPVAVSTGITSSSKFGSPAMIVGAGSATTATSGVFARVVFASELTANTIVSA